MLKVALIGSGFIATQKHLPAWKKNARFAKVVALCDVDAKRGQEIARQFGVPKSYENLGTLLETEKPDVVDICTPPRTHAPVALESLGAGAHVLIEKPMAVSQEECDSIIQAASRAKRKICVAHSDLFYSSFMAARKWVAAGRIGQFRGMRIFLSTPIDYITSKPDHWAHRLPGGVIGETGPHVIYLTLAFIPAIREVSVHAKKLLPEFPWSPYEDYRLDLIGEHATSSVTLTYATKHWAAEVDLWGSEGLIKVDLESQSLVLHRRGRLAHSEIASSTLHAASQSVRSVAGTAAKVLTGRYENTHALLLRLFLESLRDGSDPPVSASEGREAVRVMNLLVERLQAGSG
jgi:predicted dehydrogenase